MVASESLAPGPWQHSSPSSYSLSRSCMSVVHGSHCTSLAQPLLSAPSAPPLRSRHSPKLLSSSRSRRSLLSRTFSHFLTMMKQIKLSVYCSKHTRAISGERGNTTGWERSKAKRSEAKNDKGARRETGRRETSPRSLEVGHSASKSRTTTRGNQRANFGQLSGSKVHHGIGGATVLHSQHSQQRNISGES